MNHYTPATRKIVEAKIEAEIAKLDGKHREILRSIFEVPHDVELSEFGRLELTIGRFATLLASLSVQADRVQRWMVGLTVTIAAMTFVLIALTVVMLIKMT